MKNYEYQILNQTHLQKKKYDLNTFFVNLLKNPLVITQGASFDFSFYLSKKREQFGDLLPYNLKNGEKLELLLYDNSNKLFFKDKLIVFDEVLGEYGYNFNSYDIQSSGLINGKIFLNGLLLKEFKIVSMFSEIKEIVNLNTNIEEQPMGAITNLILVNSSLYIKTNVIGESFKIDTGSSILGHFNNLSIVSIDVDGTDLIINTEDNISFLLRFTSIIEAETGLDRIARIINGENIT